VVNRSVWERDLDVQLVEPIFETPQHFALHVPLLQGPDPTVSLLGLPRVASPSYRAMAWQANNQARRALLPPYPSWRHPPLDLLS
jgi:hypothetical protein